MQQQHNNWDNGWLNETFTDLTDNGHLNDTPHPDEVSDLDDPHHPEDLRGQSAVSFPQSVVTDGDNITEPPTPADSFRPITPFPAKNPRQTPATDSNLNFTSPYLSSDVLSDFNSQTFESYEDLNWVTKLIDTQHNDNQPMSVESSDEYDYRNGPTSCSSVNHDAIEWSERGGKRKADGPEDEELTEIFHGKKRRLPETISTSFFEDTFYVLDDNTINFCRGRSQNQATLEARLSHSSVPNLGYSETPGSTALHHQGIFPVDVNGNLWVTQLVSTSNNARPQSPLQPPVSPFCGTTAVNPPAPPSPLSTPDALPSLLEELLTSYTPTSQTSSEALRDWSTISQDEHSVSHTYETSANHRHHLCHQSPRGSYINSNENNLTHKNINGPRLSLMSSSQTDFLREEDDVNIGLAVSVLSDSDNLCLPETKVNGIEDFIAPLTATPWMDSCSLLQPLNNSGHQLVTVVPSPGTSHLPQIYVPSPGTSHLPQIYVPSPGTPHLPQIYVPSPGTPHLPQIYVPSPGTSHLPQIYVPSPGTSHLPQIYLPSPGTTHLPQTSVTTPRPSYQPENSVPAPGPPPLCNNSSVNIAMPNLAAEDDSPLMAQLPLDNMDPHLAETFQNACQSKSPEGLTKYILRTKILLKNNQSGKIVEESHPESQVKYEMTPEELEKSQQRRELNRLAAAKHRTSKKQQREKYEQEFNDLLNRNQELNNEVKLKKHAKEKYISDLEKAGVSKETIQLALKRFLTI